MTNLADFLLARIAEDEAAVRGAMHLGCVEQDDDPDDVIHGPLCVGRVLAECEAKRRIVRNAQAWGRSGGADQSADTLRLLALLYADHPDYREEWRP